MYRNEIISLKYIKVPAINRDIRLAISCYLKYLWFDHVEFENLD